MIDLIYRILSWDHLLPGLDRSLTHERTHSCGTPSSGASSWRMTEELRSSPSRSGDGFTGCTACTVVNGFAYWSTSDSPKSPLLLSPGFCIGINSIFKADFDTVPSDFDDTDEFWLTAEHSSCWTNENIPSTVWARLFYDFRAPLSSAMAQTLLSKCKSI